MCATACVCSFSALHACSCLCRCSKARWECTTANHSNCMVCYDTFLSPYNCKCQRNDALLTSYGYSPSPPTHTHTHTLCGCGSVVITLVAQALGPGSVVQTGSEALNHSCWILPKAWLPALTSGSTRIGSVEPSYEIPPQSIYMSWGLFPAIGISQTRHLLLAYVDFVVSYSCRILISYRAPLQVQACAHAHPSGKNSFAGNWSCTLVMYVCLPC